MGICVCVCVCVGGGGASDERGGLIMLAPSWIGNIGCGGVGTMTVRGVAADRALAFGHCRRGVLGARGPRQRNEVARVPVPRSGSKGAEWAGFVPFCQAVMNVEVEERAGKAQPCLCLLVNALTRPVLVWRTTTTRRLDGCVAW